MKERMRDRETERGGSKSFLSFMTVVLLFGLMAIDGLAQREPGTISGRVVTEDGQPIPHAKVNILGVGGVKKIMSGRMEIVTDQAGNFTADKLDPAAYTISASAPGYVLSPDEKAATKYAHIGDSVTIRLVRGGVVTGRVVNAAGEPVIGITVEAARVRDETGRPVTEQMSAGNLGLGHQTDDRGIYRIYGLAPGSYVISVGAGSMGFSLKPTPFTGRAKIYYPSATRDTAVEIAVRSGDETSGIDIRYRVERGAAISGKVTGAPVGGGQTMLTTTVVMLTKAGTDSLIGTSVVLPVGDNTGYSFYGLPNGDYELTATRSDASGSGGSMISETRKVVLIGRDLTGIDLALLPTASVSGTVSLEKMTAPAVGQKCESGRDSFLDEIILQAKPENSNQKSNTAQSMFGQLGVGNPSDKGEFTISGLKAGRHFIEAQLPDEHWFIKSVLLPSAANNPTVREAGKNGVTLKVGESLKGLSVTLAEGAAGLKGKIVAADKSRLRVHLLPNEPEAKDDVLRFAEIIADNDGSFSFANLAPGKYRVFVRVIPDTEASDKPAKPAAWNAIERAKLRKEAEETSNSTIELKPCQRVTDFRYIW